MVEFFIYFGFIRPRSIALQEARNVENRALKNYQRWKSIVIDNKI